MTTDTLPKAASRQVQIGGRTVTLTGIQQGRRHDPAEHGDDAGLHRHRRGIARPAAGAGARSGRPELQPHHHRRRHLDQRLLRAHGHRRRTRRRSRRWTARQGAARCGPRRRSWRASWRRPSCATAKARPSSSPCGRGRARPPSAAGGLCHRALAAGQDGLLRQRPQPRPHPGRRRLRRHRRSRPVPDRPVPRTTCRSSPRAAGIPPTARPTASA
jgi:hypothetical protein